MKKIGFLQFIILFSFLLLTTYLFMSFPEKQMQFSEFLDDNTSFFRELRVFTNELIEEKFQKKSDEIDLPENEEMQMFYQVYKKEYEEIMSFSYGLESDEIKNIYPIAMILRNIGIGQHELILIKSNRDIPSNSFLVSPHHSMIIGQVVNTTGNTATVMPFWNENFSCQIRILSNDGRIEDLALIEKREAISFNPSILFKKNDEVYVSEYETGGYSLKRYGWDKLGNILSLKDRDILEHYTIEFGSSREELLNQRYFLLVQ